MENISQYNSLPKRSFNGAFTSHKSVYDDVFGAGPPPKLGGLLAPRLEDYSEIFGGFHASSRSSSSSIPVLNLPLIGDDLELHFDVRSPGFDYAEVFGGDFIPPLPFSTPSFQDLVRQSSGGYDSSHDPWSPAQSGSFSDELEPLAGSDEASHSLSDANGGDQSLDDTTHLFNVSHNKSSQTNNETVLTETNHATNCGVIPGPTISDSENPVPGNEEEQYCSSSHATDESNSSKEFGARVTDENPLQKRGKSSSPRAKPFMTVSDISLRTKPSRLPPPSRPPPALVVKKGEYDAKPEASKSYAFERLADDSALFFDVEVDVSVSSEGTENGNKNVHQSIEGENMLQSHGKETSASALATEDRIGSTKSTENTSESQEVQFSNHIADSSVAWTEGTEYFEVVDKTICRPAFETIEDCDIQMQHTNPDAYIHRRPIDSVAFDQDNKKYVVGKESPRWDDNKNQPEMGREDHELGDNLEIKTQSTRLSNQKELQEIVILNKLTSLYDSNGMVPEKIQRVEESATLQDSHESIKGRTEAKGNLNEVEANPSLKASVKKMDIGKRFIDAQMTKKSSRKHEEHIVRDEFQRRLEDVEGAETGERIKKITEQEEIEGACIKGNKNKVNETFEAKETEKNDEESELTEKNGYEREVKWDSENDVLLEGDQLKSFDGACKVDEGNVIKLGGKLDNPRIWEATQAAVLSEGDSELKTELSSNVYEPEAGNFNRFSKNKDELQDRNTHCEANNTEDSHSLPKHKTDSNTGGICKGVSHIMPNKTFSVMNYSHEPEKIQATQFIVKKLDVRDSFREPLVNGMKVKDASPVFVHNDDTLSSSKDSISQRIERTEKNTIEQKERDRARRETEMENEYMRKIEEEREREREREKDRMAVDKAALEARERSYAEARERASAEVRQRAMSEARERLEKASMEARLRTERAAVERATAEARQRAAEKSSMANKAAFGSHNRVEKFVSDRFPASFRSADTRQSSFSSDLHYKSSGTLNGLRNSYSSAHYGAESESPQRCQARLERYRRTAERAANALAEKNKRDLLAQREREERNRVAETIDAEVKRWSSGKEGNLRALLSTLQYILGPGSGWQPVPLTEVITSAAVKKAYRKATLCVHPDKLQQRGATVQQKYICEKVFDLLKEAWNKFNSEER